MPHSYTDIPGAGTTLQLKISASYVDIPGASDISWDGLKRGVRNPTALTSPSVVKKPGMTDYGQVKCKVFLDPNDSTHQAVRDKLTVVAADATIDDWKLIYADGGMTPAEATFKGFVSEFSHASGEPETGTMTADLTIEVSALTAFTEGSEGY